MKHLSSRLAVQSVGGRPTSGNYSLATGTIKIFRPSLFLDLPESLHTFHAKRNVMCTIFNVCSKLKIYNRTTVLVKLIKHFTVLSGRVSFHWYHYLPHTYDCVIHFANDILITIATTFIPNINTIIPSRL